MPSTTDGDGDAAPASTSTSTSANPSSRLLAALSNLRLTPTQASNLPHTSNLPRTTPNEPPHSPTYWFMRPAHTHAQHPLAPPSGINLPAEYDDTAPLLLEYLDDMLEREANGEREFWTWERVARKVRMEGKWKGEMGWGS